jgi:hypothetical protein
MALWVRRRESDLIDLLFACFGSATGFRVRSIERQSRGPENDREEAKPQCSSKQIEKRQGLKIAGPEKIDFHWGHNTALSPEP